MPETGWTAEGAIIPRGAQQRGPSGPLSGLRVVELAGIGPGPFAAMLLADMGADVIRVDRPSGGTSVIDPELDATRRSHRSVVLDLRNPEGVKTVLSLVEQADILIEGFRPGTTEAMGLGPDECLKRNPRLIYGRMTGWGQDGPLAHTAGHDIGYLALTGALHAMGRKGEAPAIPINLVGDYGGGSLYLVVGVLAAAFEASRSGHGQVVDAAIVDGAASMTATTHSLMAGEMWRDERGVNILDGGRPWYDVYETKDGKHLAVGALEPKFYADFMTGLGLEPDEQERSDQSCWPALRQRIAGVLLTRSRDEWAAVFENTDACVAPVLSLTEAPNHPHLAARNTFSKVNGVPQPSPAPRFSRTPSRVQSPPSAPGSATATALADWGIDDVQGLLDSGVAVQA